MIGVVADHPVAEEESVTRSPSEDSSGSVSGQALDRQAQRVTDGRSEQHTSKTRTVLRFMTHAIRDQILANLEWRKLTDGSVSS
jgi:hypothetical protein